MKTLLVPLFLLLSSLSIYAQTYLTRVVKDQLFIPWEIIYGPDQHIWFTQKSGYVCRLNPVNGDLDTLYHETHVAIAGEGGMLGMALHPDFETTPYVYVAYNYYDGPTYKERIVRYTYNGIQLEVPFVLLDNIHGSSNHNGCRLVIVGDKLFISTGDAEVPADAQSTSALNGKILRINLDGSIPSDNPFAGSPVWNWGQRNTQGMTYANGNLYGAMHGASSDDEINIFVANRNYGWPNVEGYCNTTTELSFCNSNNVVEPIYAWTPTLAVCGIEYYDHDMYPDLQQSLIMCTLKDQHLYQLKLNGTFDDVVSATVITNAVNVGRLRDVCISPQGSIFISTSNSNSDGTGSPIDKIIELYDPHATEVVQPRPSEELVLFPNPIVDVLHLSSTSLQGKSCEFVLHDLSGKVLMKGEGTFPFYIELPALNNGMYVLECRGDEGSVMVEKFCKAK